jgi:hypothetical protein
MERRYFCIWGIIIFFRCMNKAFFYQNNVIIFFNCKLFPYKNIQVWIGIRVQQVAWIRIRTQGTISMSIYIFPYRYMRHNTYLLSTSRWKGTVPNDSKYADWPCICTAKTLYPKFETNIPRNETARPHSTFMYLRAIHVFTASVCLFAATK